MEWTFVADSAAVPEGALVPVYPKGLNIVLARVEGRVYALSGACVHMACPMFRGSLDGYVLRCPCHDWRYDVRTGAMLDAPELALGSYPVDDRDGRLYLCID